MRIINPAPERAYLSALTEKYRVPGFCAAVIQNGRVSGIIPVGVKKAGASDPIREDTTFEAASLTKTVFACLCALLDIPLGAPVCGICREDGYTQSPYMDEVTPRHILSHGAGLPNWSARPVGFLFPPGTSFGYSGEGYFYLQRALERLTGKGFPALLREKILAPLGMQNSEAVWTPHIYGLEATSHDAEGKPNELRSGVDAEGLAPEPNAAWSLYTTAADYAKFMAWFIKNAERFSEHTKKQNTANDAMFWGLGFGIPAKDENVLWHWGDNGGYKNMMALDLRTRDGICVFSNGYNGNALEIELMETMTDGAFWQDVKRFIAEQ